MKNSHLLAFGACVIASASALGDLIFTGPSVYELNSNTTRLDSTAPGIEAALQAGAGTFTTRNLTAHQINFGATVGNLNPRVFFGLRTMDAPVEISNLQTSFIGTATFSGGGPNTSYTAKATGETSVWRHNDLNGNGFLEGPEPLHELGKWPGVLGSFNASGSFNYNQTFGAGRLSLILAPNTSYVILQDFFIDFVGSGSPLDPSVVLSSDWSLPLARHQTTFNFRAIPEPSNVFFLAIAASLILILRRRKASSVAVT